MENRFFLFLLIICSLNLAPLAYAEEAEPVSTAVPESGTDQPATKDGEEAPLEEPLLVPVVKRNQIKLAKIDTENFQVGIYGGLFSIEDFGVNPVYGARVGLLLSESFFLDATMGLTKAGRSAAEKLFQFDLLTEQERELVYYDISFGYNLLPGEAFVGEDKAFTTALYVTIGAGSTQFGGDDRFTIVGGFGYRLVWTDWMAFQVDFRDHVFETDIIGESEIKHNFEYVIGSTWFF